LNNIKESNTRHCLLVFI